jgi:putative CocE/NonD family hydrolase
MFYQGGAFAYESALFWATRSYSKIDTPMRFEKLKKGYDFSPMIEADNRVVCDIPFFNEWILHNTFDDYWQKVDGTERNKKITVPNLIMAGWYDPFLNSQIEDFENINKYAPKNIAQASRLIIGPWAHAETIEMPNGYKDDNYRLKSIAPSLKWYDQHLKGIIHNKIPPVEIFVMGINKWRYENSFPLESTNYTNWYLNSNTYNTIDSVPISKSVSKSYYYNPNNPTPSVGGSMLGPRAGPKLQNNLDKRKDILRYDSKVLTNPIEITGKIKLILYVSTNVANTDFIAKLIDVYPDGSAFNISEGVIRKSYKGKDQIEMIEIELNPTSNVFMKGHKIRLEISSSNYPRFSLNYNTGGKNYNEKTGVIAEQKVYTGSITPSKLILPIIPNSLK